MIPFILFMMVNTIRMKKGQNTVGWTLGTTARVILFFAFLVLALLVFIRFMHLKYQFS